MLIVKVKESESIDRALKSLKRKFDKTQVVKELRSRKEFKKPSEKRRETVKLAKYKQQRLNSLSND